MKSPWLSFQPFVIYPQRMSLFYPNRRLDPNNMYEMQTTKLVQEYYFEMNAMIEMLQKQGLTIKLSRVPTINEGASNLKISVQIKNEMNTMTFFFRNMHQTWTHRFELACQVDFCSCLLKLPISLIRSTSSIRDGGDKVAHDEENTRLMCNYSYLMG
jgi:hypothetical protein